MTESAYRSKVSQKTLEESQPEHAMPSRMAEENWQERPISGGLSWGKVALITGIASLLALLVYNAVSGLLADFERYPITSSVLGTLLGIFVLSVSIVILRELIAYRRVNRFIDSRQPLGALRELPTVADVDRALDSQASQFGRHSFAEHCYRHYQTLKRDDQSAKERVDLYQHHVQQPVQARASSVLKRESMTAGSLAFISPNALIQTLAVMWISLRTIRRMAQVYGLRPGTAGNWRLVNVLVQNIAAQSLFDLATDEVVNQISGTLSAKLMENSAEAVAAGALNVRLGKALIKLLR
ncbi:YcjF family protein [Alteromonas halophila]|uniref:DUF697 domain-containing protein n=1 Tax=Alteromonas halophila TaxID=516698 RepID=A0A918MYV3_9ALTE|nr:YcjF family protein [Alteromonas halophila]GGW84653.1 hypothetical protein GCM10007391_18000 [Alteromonas halophila]